MHFPLDNLAQVFWRVLADHRAAVAAGNVRAARLSAYEIASFADCTLHPRVRRRAIEALEILAGARQPGQMIARSALRGVGHASR